LGFFHGFQRAAAAENGLCAVLLYLVPLRLGVLPDASTLPRPVASAVTITTALGLPAGSLW